MENDVKNLDERHELLFSMLVTYRVLLKWFIDRHVYGGENSGQYLKEFAKAGRIVYHEHRSKGAFRNHVAYAMLSAKEAAARGVKDRAKLKNASISAAEQVAWICMTQGIYRCETEEIENLLQTRIPSNIAFVIGEVGKQQRRPVLLRVLCSSDNTIGCYKRVRQIAEKLAEQFPKLTQRRLLGILCLLDDQKRVTSLKKVLHAKTPTAAPLIDEFFLKVEYAPTPDQVWKAIKGLRQA